MPSLRKHPHARALTAVLLAGPAARRPFRAVRKRDRAADTYTYVWKTEKGWAATCRKLVVRLSDGSQHTATFCFTR